MGGVGAGQAALGGGVRGAEGAPLYLPQLPGSEGPHSPSTACRSRCSWKQL